MRLAESMVNIQSLPQVPIMRLFLLIAAATLAAAQLDPVQDFCRRHQHQTCVIDSKLYIDGGKVYHGGSVENDTVARQSKLNGVWAHRPR
jgi:hypothetical protein